MYCVMVETGGSDVYLKAQICGSDGGGFSLALSLMDVIKNLWVMIKSVDRSSAPETI